MSMASVQFGRRCVYFELQMGESFVYRDCNVKMLLAKAESLFGLFRVEYAKMFTLEEALFLEVSRCFLIIEFKTNYQSMIHLLICLESILLKVFS